MMDLSTTALEKDMGQALLKRLQQEFELNLDAYLTEYDSAFGDTIKAARYALFSGGKRLRPLLLLSTLESFNNPARNALHAAFSLEMIHTYSLIHDDLPAMDDDDFRRGKPTVHKAFDEGTAILAGDLLVTLAFETLTNAPYSSELKVNLIQTLAKASGPFGMIGGQAMDLFFEGKECSLNHLNLMHRLKTGALIASALEFAAMFLNKDPTPFMELGYSIGLAFQIKNDLEDDRQSDVKNQKATYLSKVENPLKFFEQEKEKVTQLLARLELLESPLHQLIKLIL